MNDFTKMVIADLTTKSNIEKNLTLKLWNEGASKKLVIEIKDIPLVHLVSLLAEHGNEMSNVHIYHEDIDEIQK